MIGHKIKTGVWVGLLPGYKIAGSTANRARLKSGFGDWPWGVSCPTFCCRNL